MTTLPVKLPWKVKSLKKTCLICICRHINYWMEGLPENCDDYLYILSPFDTIGSALTQDILNTLVELENFRPQMLHLLLHPSLSSVDLSSCIKLYGVGDMALKILYKRCRKLKRLNLLGRTRLCNNSIFNKLPTAPLSKSLVDLRVTHDAITDKFVQMLAENCKSLLYLHIENCMKLTEAGFLQLEMFTRLEELKLSISNFPNFKDKTLLQLLKSMKQLRTLIISMARVSLHFLECEQNLKCYKLSILKLECTAIDDWSVDLITSSFASLRELTISHCHSVTVKSLEYLKRCTLTKLELFDTGITEVVPELEDLCRFYGKNLHSLRLSGIANLNISKIAICCPFLESLYLSQCQRLQSKWINKDFLVREKCNRYSAVSDVCFSVCEVCPSLKTLYLDCDCINPERNNFQPTHVLKNGRGLVSLSLVGIPILNDESLRQLLECFDCKSVRHLDLSQNTAVTVNGIYHVLEKCDSLQTLQVAKCDIVRQEFVELVNLLKKRNADVIINNIEFW